MREWSERLRQLGARFSGGDCHFRYGRLTDGQICFEGMDLDASPVAFEGTGVCSAVEIDWSDFPATAVNQP